MHLEGRKLIIFIREFVRNRVGYFSSCFIIYRSGFYLHRVLISISFQDSRPRSGIAPFSFIVHTSDATDFRARFHSHQQMSGDFQRFASRVNFTLHEVLKCYTIVIDDFTIQSPISRVFRFFAPLCIVHNF